MTVSAERTAAVEPTASTSSSATPAEPLAGDEILRRTLRRHAAGVAVITVPGPAGFTATSFTSVSLEPALVSFCLGITASTLAAVQSAECFAVHVLGTGNTTLARQFARSGIDRFAGVPWTEGPDGLPLLEGVPAWLTARVTLRQRIGDHLLVVGEPESSGGHGEGPALVYHDGAFATSVPLPPHPGA